MAVGLRLYPRYLVYFEKRQEPHCPIATYVHGAVRCRRLPQVKKEFIFCLKINNHVHIIQPEQLKLSELTMVTIRELNDPTTQRNSRYSFGICSVSRLVPNLSRVASPLNKRLRIDQNTLFPRLILGQKGFSR